MLIASPGKTLGTERLLMRVLLIEDASRLAQAIVHMFKQRAIAVDSVGDGALGLEYALRGDYDVIICDIMLPSLDGWSIVERLRKQGMTTPVLMLTAKGQTSDRVRGLELGADDYLVKPFEMEELLARIRALARRSGPIEELDELCFGDLCLDSTRLRLECRGHSYALTPKEALVLEALLRGAGGRNSASPVNSTDPTNFAAPTNPATTSFAAPTNSATPVTKERLLAAAWGPGSEATAANLEDYISFLRKKLTRAESSTQIRTVRGVGYVLEN
jgi:DNA-binding response OmpR family regulator